MALFKLMPPQVAFLTILQLANKLAAFTVAIAVPTSTDVPTFNVFKNASVVAATLDIKLLQNLITWILNDVQLVRMAQV